MRTQQDEGKEEVFFLEETVSVGGISSTHPAAALSKELKIAVHHSYSFDITAETLCGAYVQVR